MAQKLPDTITLGGIALSRKRDFYGKLTTTWVDDKNYCELVRNSTGQWSFNGSVLKHHWACPGWFNTPEQAFNATILHQIDRVRTQHEQEIKALTAVLPEPLRYAVPKVPMLDHDPPKDPERLLQENANLREECDRLRAGKFNEGDHMSYGAERKYVSTRGFPLIWSTHEPPIDSAITAEFYQKWYELYIVHANGKVEQLPYGELEEYTPAGESTYRDHVPNPKAVHSYAEARNWSIDLIFWEVLQGRWLEETL